MAPTLFVGELPKGTGGRKPKELDAELRDALIAALRDNPLTENKRPTIIGDASRLFDTEGKASSDGRRYGRAAAEALDKTVKVRVVESSPGSGQWGWVLYIPMSESDPSLAKPSGKKESGKK